MTTDPINRLEAVFGLIVDQARSDPAFARRMLQLLDVPIQFVGPEATAAIDPIILAGQGYEAFRSALGTFPDADLKKIIKTFDLAAPSQMKGLKRFGLVDLMWSAASQRRADMSV